MPTHLNFHAPLNPVTALLQLWKYRGLILQFSRREILRRYRGSFLGLVWAFVQPLLMLAVYTFVFSVIFEAKWGQEIDQSRLSFAMALFTGILTFNIIGDTVNASPTLIFSNPNFVKKVVFPLEILPLVKLIESMIYSFFGMSVLIAAQVLETHHLHWTLIFLPLVWLPVALFSLGWSYFIASLGVFIRDIGSVTHVAVTMLFFLSPIFYPLSAIPENLRLYCRLNPIAVFVQDSRRVILWGQMPDWPGFWICFFISLAVFVLGFAWFMKTKHAFADVM